MSLGTAGRNAAASGVAGVATYLALNTADPGTTGANLATSARQAITWGSPSSGAISITGTPKNFTGGASNGPCTHYSLWTASTGGSFVGGGALTGDQTFNAAGEYVVDSITYTQNA